MLEVRGLQLREDAEPFDHAFAAGRICVALGANLAGKSDLCRLIAGLPTQARVRSISLNGEDMTQVPTRDRSVALVYQAFVNYPGWRVADNIASPMRARGDAREEIDLQVEELAATLGLSDLLHRYPHELSGGQQQRVALARALAKNADVLLLDQPLVNLDYKLREAMRDELRLLLHRRSTVVIYTTSEPREAFSLGDEVLLLKDGARLQAGAPLDVYRQPRTRAAMDLLAEPRANRTSKGGGVRPEHVSLDPVDGAAARSLDVIASETNGSESFVHGVCEGHEWVVRAPGIVTLQPGQTVPVYVREEDVVVFDRA